MAASLFRLPIRYLRHIVSHFNRPLYLKWLLRHSERLEQFRDKHKGEDCFLIGNGPSLNKMDLNLLNDYHTIGLNKIYLIFEKIPLRLSYHVAVNPLVIRQSVQPFSNLPCPSFLSYIPARRLFEPQSRIYYLFTGEPPFGFSTDPRSVIFEGGTVTYVALQLAFFMGFDRVFLIGVDHNFQVQGKPNEKQTLHGIDSNHFHPDYFAGQEWHLPDLECSEVFYRLAHFVYLRYNRQIIDATVDGKLNIFPKTTFEEALSICRKRKNEEV